MIEGIRMGGATGVAQLAIADNGTLVLTQGAATAVGNLVWVDRTGRAEPTGAPAQAYGYARLSPDGTKILATTTDGDADLWLWDIARKTSTRLTSGPETDSYPVWTADSKFILFRSGPGGTDKIDLFRRAVDGTGDALRLSDASLVDTPMAILKDGRVLLRRTPNDTSPLGTLEILPVETGAKPVPLFAKQPAAIVNAEISPDGRWLAYQSSEGSTRNEIHVRPFPNVESGHWQISSALSSRPMWSKSASSLELFYHAVLSGGIARLMRVTVPAIPAGAPFTFGASEPLLDLSGYSAGALGRAWDISADGKRFLMVKVANAEPVERNSMIVVTHWFDELKARSKPVR